MQTQTKLPPTSLDRFCQQQSSRTPLIERLHFPLELSASLTETAGDLVCEAIRCRRRDSLNARKDWHKLVYNLSQYPPGRSGSSEGCSWLVR
jgi:hypothetical protein